MKSFLDIIHNRIAITQELIDSKEHKLLHISDTPTNIYPAIYHLISKLKPETIIHTGDLADDIKLEQNPQLLDHYLSAVEPFIKNLTENTDSLYICPGNHDSPDFLEMQNNIFKLVKSGHIISIMGKSISISHCYEDLAPNANYKLFGHGSDGNFSCADKNLLDGIKYIHVLLLPSEKLFFLAYPYGTNHYRKYKSITPTLL